MVIGGKVDDQGSASVLVYDPEEDAWATAAPLPRPEFFSPDLAAARLQMNANGEIVCLYGPQGTSQRRDRHTSLWVTDAGSGICHAPSGEPRALLLG